MAKVIASTYEIIKQIGSGGGGNVYLANHMRLGKLVVLKADKRKITTRPELLRREVDILKDLRHSYIPKVYDYFVENDITYTVMDYIEGESLDKPLKRGEKFAQPQVIKWAKQILEALCYLHSPTHGNPPRGYVHSDIKPANVMRTPYDDICLIDFNIALALGEENVVGHSEGYASPEHYGLDFSGFGGDLTSREADTEDIAHEGESTQTDIPTQTTETVDGETETIFMRGAAYRPSALSYRQTRSSYKKVVPDVRSDIYSVGATLYHLLSGRRPAKYADKVIPLSEKEFSPQVVKIITKAMNPNPDLRYQTAADMLRDFISLRKNDPRVKRLKRQSRIVCGVSVFLICVGIGSAFIGLKRTQVMERGQKLAEYSENALEEGNIDLAIRYVLDAIPEKNNLITPEPAPEVQKALTDVLGVYDLRDGFQKSGTVELQKNPLYLTIAPNGQIAACMYEGGSAVIDTSTAKIIAKLPAVDSAMAEVEFLDDDTIIYAGIDGIAAYSVSKRMELWKGEPATAISVSQDGGTVAAIYKDESHAAVYDAQTGKKIKEIDFHGKNQSVSMVSDNFANLYNNLFAVSSDGNLLAVSFADGSLALFNVQTGEKDLEVLNNNSGYTYFEGGFSGNYLAFSASGDENSIFAVIDGVKKKQTVGMESESSFHTKSDKNGIYIQVNNILVKIDPETAEQTPLVNIEETIRQFTIGEEYVAISVQDKILVFKKNNAELITEVEGMGETDLLQISGDIVLNARIDTPAIRIMKYEDYSQAEVAKYDPSFKHDEARISADGKTIILFSYKEFGIFDLNGNLLAEVQIPQSETVYDQQFIRKGNKSYLEVTYNDGRVLTYDAGNGKLTAESNAEVPDMTLEEEFYTDDFLITAPLHGAPQVYDIESGNKICELEEDAYLTYVTQADKYIIAQYVTAEGFCYGVLMDGRCQELAYLPYLSDVWKNELYFDNPAGSMRKSQIYSLNNLVEMAERISGRN